MVWASSFFREICPVFSKCRRKEVQSLLCYVAKDYTENPTSGRTKCPLAAEPKQIAPKQSLYMEKLL
jgi:hypothetical protein